MIKILAKKIKMSQIWQNDQVVPVTILKTQEEIPIELKEGLLVKISGKSKGKGFQGVVKRHGFKGGPKTHGQKDRLRAPGSIGPTAPQRTIKGRKMAGHMGLKTVTIKNIQIVKVDKENNLVFIKGAAPGMRGSKIEIRI